MSSLVPGYMAVSWTVSPPAVGVRATCGVEGRPEGEGEGEWEGSGGEDGLCDYTCVQVHVSANTNSGEWGRKMGGGRRIDMTRCTWLHAHTSSPRRGLTVVLTHTVPNMLDRVTLREYSVPACSPMM